MVFKILGGAIGYSVFRAQGALLGVMIGHAVDAGLSVRRTKRRKEAQLKERRSAEANRTYFISMFSMLAKLVKADGAVSPEEIQCVDKIMTEVFKLDRKGLKAAREIFSEAKDSATGFHLYAAQLFESAQAQGYLLEGTLDLLFRVALSDGPLNSDEERLIRNTAEIFNIEQAKYLALRRRYSPDLNGHSKEKQSDIELPLIEQCYKVLGCAKTDSPEEIKSRYRKLVAEYHPDKIVSKDLPSGFIDFAHEKFRNIQSAYETLKRERGL